MKSPTTVTNIANKIEKEISSKITTWYKLLLDGKLLSYEKEVQKYLVEIFDVIAERLLPEASKAIVSEQKEVLIKVGCRKLEERKFRIRLSTGKEVRVISNYAKEVPEDWQGTRHSIARHWKIIGNDSPGLYDRVGFCSALSASYDLGQQLLSKFNSEVCLSSVRDITNRLADYCFRQKEEELIVESDESLEGKRVVISIDGGRTRTRTYTGDVNKTGHDKFATNWMEPKLFVIDVLDDSGRPDRNSLPVYGGRFGEQDMFDLLSRHLKRLEIKKAKSIQILADGAPWIWNNTQNILLELGVEKDKIVETLDYYHSKSYLHDLVEAMPKSINKEEKKALLGQFCDMLWNGNSGKIVTRCKQIFKRPNALINRWINYLDKHKNRTQYAEYQREGFMCGSGIIESAIRRVINLRFKNASTFWNEEKVEKMYFLRGALVSKRWDILMNNLVN